LKALKSKNTGEVDFMIIRENTEGEFGEIGSIVGPEKS
jgi:isocitrate/isopropylmalate dehydrogenase